MSNDEYYTPQWVFDEMGLQFDLDVACPLEGPVNVPAAHHYTKLDDGLTSPWFGRVWMNPPYSKCTPWVERFMEYRNGVCLVPFARSKWCNKLWNDADAIVMMPSTFKFVQGSIFIQTMLAAYGVSNVEGISRLGRSR